MAAWRAMKAHSEVSCRDKLFWFAVFTAAHAAF